MGLSSAGKGEQSKWIRDRFFDSSPTARMFATSLPSAFSDLPKDSVLLSCAACVNNNNWKICLGVALAGKMCHHRGFIYATMGNIEIVAVNSRVEGLPSFSHILETTKNKTFHVDFLGRPSHCWEQLEPFQHLKWWLMGKLLRRVQNLVRSVKAVANSFQTVQLGWVVELHPLYHAQREVNLLR